MKRFLLWVLGVVLGVAIFLGGVIGLSWRSTGEQSLPDDTGISFAGAPLEKNGYCWQIPLVGALADRVFAQSNTLSTQKLGDIAVAAPRLRLPDWASPEISELTVRHKDSGELAFSGTIEEYADFCFTENGAYTAEMQLWRLPVGMEKSQLAGAYDKVVRDPRLEQPARPMGWYGYRFSFDLMAAPQVTLSADRIRQGETVAVWVTGLPGEEPPVLSSELGKVQFIRDGDGWLGYLGAAYNADAKKHTITVTMGDVKSTVELVVTDRNFGNAPGIPDPEPLPGAEEEFRNTVWPLYTAPSGPRKWVVAWDKPVTNQKILIGYGMYQMWNGKQGRKTNSTVYATTPGTQVITPTAGTVVLAKNLLLTGNTVVIDHGAGVRSYLYGLADIYVKEGDELALCNPVGSTAETLTFDVKIGNKSISPDELYLGLGGLFAAN